MHAVRIFAEFHRISRLARPGRCNLQSAKMASVAVCKTKTYSRPKTRGIQTNLAAKTGPAYGLLIIRSPKDDYRACQTVMVLVIGGPRQKVYEPKSQWEQEWPNERGPEGHAHPV
jgi:hypothetical protein